MTNGIRCFHPDASERSDLRNEDRRDDYPTHWYCPDCDTYFPLIGDTDHWIVYKTLDQEIASDIQTEEPCPECGTVPYDGHVCEDASDSQTLPPKT